MRENPTSCCEGALVHPARGGHPTPRSVLLLLKSPLLLMDTGSAQSQLSCTSPTVSLAPGWIQKRLPMCRAAPQRGPWCEGLKGKGRPMVTICHCSGAWGGGRHGMCGAW